MPPEDSRVGERVPAAMRIKLKYPDVETFIQRYSVNISRGGIFIATRTPKPVGTVVRFEFQLATSTPVIRGEGQVIWVKPYDPEQPRRVHGMGVRFTRLDSESRQIIDRALLWKKEHEGLEGAAPPREEGDDLVETSGGIMVPEGRLAEASDPPREPREPPPFPERSDSGLYAQVEVVRGAQVEARAEEPAPLPDPPAPPPMALSPLPTPTEEEQREIIAELFQSTQSQVVRAAHQIAEVAAAQNLFPEDAELQELLRPLRIPMPETGREAAHLLREILDRPQR